MQLTISASGFATKTGKVSFGAENFFDHRHDGIVFSNLTSPAQALTERAAFVDDDAPFTVNFIPRGFASVPVDAQQIFVRAMAEAHLPARSSRPAESA